MCTTSLVLIAKNVLRSNGLLLLVPLVRSMSFGNSLQNPLSKVIRASRASRALRVLRFLWRSIAQVFADHCNPHTCHATAIKVQIRTDDMTRSTKRHFQPSIDTYLHCSPSNQQDHVTAAVPSPFPPLPKTIQSSLLNVGMRVRKSVPEGYKTTVTPNKSFAATSICHDGPTFAENPIRTHKALLPYCGILKVGDLATQPVPDEEDLPQLQFDDDWSLPSSSQESNMSAISHGNVVAEMPRAAFGKKKRQRDDEDNEDLIPNFQPISPYLQSENPTPFSNLSHNRPVAIPRTRRQPNARLCGAGIHESKMVDVADFEEATFFRPEEWMIDTTDWGNV